MNCLTTAPIMNLFSSTRTKRRTAFAVLLVWLFAVASGVANACLLEVSEASSTHAHAAVAASAHTGDPAAVSAGHAEAGDVHDDDSRTSAPPFLKVCDDGSTALVKLNAYPFFSHGLWPVYVPLAVLLIVPSGWSRGALTALVAAGSARPAPSMRRGSSRCGVCSLRC